MPSIHTESELWMRNGSGPILSRRVHDAATGFQQQAALIGDDDFGRGALLQMRFELVGVVMHVDDGARDAGGGQPVEHVIDQRAPGERHERLGDVVRQRPHARAEPGCEHESRCRPWAASSCANIQVRLSDRQRARAPLGREGCVHTTR